MNAVYQSQSYVATDGQSASLSWRQAPIWDLRTDFYYCQTIASMLRWGALSDERTGLPFTIAAGLASAVILGPESCGTRDPRDHILLSQIRDFPNLEGQVSVFISSRNRVAQLYSRALGSLFVASYGSQGSAGGIRTSLHAGLHQNQKVLGRT
jgi:hypothetical protein